MVRKRFVYEGFGFPVILRNVPMVKVHGQWTPKIDYNELAVYVLFALARKPWRLTGDEMRFIRLHFEMTLTQFGDRFSVSHPAVCGYISISRWVSLTNSARTAQCFVPTMAGVSEVEQSPLLFDSKLEQRFFRDLRRAAPEWEVLREADPVQVGRQILCPDFTLVHPARRLRIPVEIVGYLPSLLMSCSKPARRSRSVKVL